MTAHKNLVNFGFPILKRPETELVRLTSMGKKLRREDNFREKRESISLRPVTQRVQSILSYLTETRRM